MKWGEDLEMVLQPQHREVGARSSGAAAARPTAHIAALFSHRPQSIWSQKHRIHKGRGASLVSPRTFYRCTCSL